AVVGLVVLTRTPLRDAADRTVAGVRPLTSGLNHRLASLFRLPYEDDAVQVEPRIDDIDPALVTDDDTLVEPPSDDTPAEPTPEKARKRKPPKFVAPEPDAVEPEQLEIALGAAAKGSPW